MQFRQRIRVAAPRLGPKRVREQGVEPEPAGARRRGARGRGGRARGRRGVRRRRCRPSTRRTVARTAGRAPRPRAGTRGPAPAGAAAPRGSGSRSTCRCPPAKERTKVATSSRPRSDSAASCRPVTHPSVRASSSRALLRRHGEAHRTREEGRRLVGSRSADPRRGARAPGRAPAAARPAGAAPAASSSTRCSRVGACSTRKVISSRMPVDVHQVVVVEHERDRVGCRRPSR